MMVEFTKLQDKAVMFYNEKGYIPTSLALLGYTPGDVSGNVFGSPTGPSPTNFEGFGAMNLISSYPANPVCAEMFSVGYSFAIPTEAYAIDGEYLSTIEYFYHFNNGQVYPHCFYTFVDMITATPTTEDLGIGGCSNSYLAGSTAYDDLFTIYSSLPASGCT